MGTPSPRAAWRGPTLRVAISLGLLGAILWWIPWQDFARAIARVPGPLWLFVAGVFLLGHAASALKWRLLLGAVGVRVSRALALRAHGLGLFANLCLPSLIGGDLVRAAVAIRDQGRAEAVAIASLGDRVNDTMALVLLASLAALAIGGAGDALPLRVLMALGLGLPLAVALAIAAVPRLPTARMPAALARVTGRVIEARASLLARPLRAAAAFGLSLAIQSVFVWLNFRLALAIGIDQPLAVWFLAWPLAKLIALLPISLGGLGVRELALAGLLAPFGVETALTVAQSLAWQAVLIGSGLSAGLAAFSLGERSLSLPMPSKETP